VEEHILASHHSAKPLDAVRLGLLAKKFADGVPEEEFSVAALQGCEFPFIADAMQV
jgi:chaperone BCS1